MKNKKKEQDKLQNEMAKISNKENEILESYSEDVVEYNEKVNYEDEEIDQKEDKKETIRKETKKKAKDNNKEKIILKSEIKNNEKTKKYKRIINIGFTIIMICLSMIAIDVIYVAKYERGPFFAIPVKTYDDGGTKEYLGIGYKVIAYNQILGRKDKVIGTLGLKYNTEPLNIDDIDLAIAFTDNEEETYKKYYKKFVRIDTKVQSKNMQNNTMITGYNDEGGKYTLNILCYNDFSPDDLNRLNIEEKVYIVGTIREYKNNSKKNSKKLVLSDCFIY